MAARVGSVKCKPGCVRRGFGKAERYETAEHELRNIVGISERQLPDRRLLVTRQFLPERQSARFS
jgi:hypothetical protein